MNVVADTGAIGSRIVGAINRYFGAKAQRRIQNEWNQVRFGTVVFSAPDCRAGGIEVAQA